MLLFIHQQCGQCSSHKHTHRPIKNKVDELEIHVILLSLLMKIINHHISRF